MFRVVMDFIPGQSQISGSTWARFALERATFARHLSPPRFRWRLLSNSVFLEYLAILISSRLVFQDIKKHLNAS